MMSVLSLAFGAIVRVRGALYDRGWLAAERAARPVISVGNLAVGGTGKTPFVLLLVKKLAARGETPAILSRGYGAKRPPRHAAVVSRGRGPELDAHVAGDEPVLLAKKSSARVVIARRRIEAAKIAAGELGATVLVLDDGFQHRRLARDLDIVLLDAADPFAGGRLLPSGRLREPPSALDRAGLLVLVGDPDARFDRPAVRVIARAAPPVPEIKGRRVALLAAIARPERFESTARALGAEIVHTDFHRDHRVLDARALEAFAIAAKAARAELLLTTEKDAARQPLPGLIPLAIEHHIVAGEELLDRALDRVLANCEAR
jgi:tetraacyldisaccharide 4'-kinase